MLFFWILIFLFSLTLLIKSADWLVESAEKIGLAFRISPFIIGVTIVAIGTSLPELASSVAAVLKDKTEIVSANAVGSNIANILLIIGISAVLARSLSVKRSLIDLDAPLLASTTILFLFIAWDKKINFVEGLLLLFAFLIYLLYTIFQRREETEETQEVLPSRIERREKEAQKLIKDKESLNWKVFFFLILGVLGLAVGANYTIESMVQISKILHIPSSLIAITALAVGTSLPELIVSAKAALRKKYEMALGNVFGSNVFNLLLVVGIPSLIKNLNIDQQTFTIGIPMMVVATFLFVISGISKKIHIWEGAMYLIIYLFFILKLYGLV